MNLDDRLVLTVPTERQIAFQQTEYYNFIHFGLNTFTKKEWGNGKVPPSAFDIEDIDTDEWVKALKETGSNGIIITAKHHDGFCLYPSKFTDYTIAATRYRKGKGDLVKQLQLSCEKYGLKFGIYLSPWDRHEKTYGSEAYNDFFCNQLIELCTNYGKIFCFWFDGACGEGENGKVQRYDWQRYFDIIRKLQPDACISNCGPDVRWIGNEHGIARKKEYSVVPARMQCYDKVMAQSQQKEGAFKMLAKIDHRDKCLGSRELLEKEDKLCWWPAEMNIPITYVGWFYRPLFRVLFTRSVKNLVKCYINSVGANATLLINVPPDKKGKLPDKFIKRLCDARRRIEHIFEKPLNCEVVGKGNVFCAETKGEDVSCVVLAEDIRYSQRVERFTIKADGKTVYEGNTVGYKKICILKKTVKCGRIEVTVDDCRKEPHLLSIKLYG